MFRFTISVTSLTDRRRIHAGRQGATRQHLPSSPCTPWSPTSAFRTVLTSSAFALSASSRTPPPLFELLSQFNDLDGLARNHVQRNDAGLSDTASRPCRLIGVCRVQLKDDTPRHRRLQPRRSPCRLRQRADSQRDDRDAAVCTSGIPIRACKGISNAFPTTPRSMS